MSISKYDATRAGQIDGERRAMFLLRDRPTRDEIESFLMPRNIDAIVDNAGRSAEQDYLPSLRGRKARGRERTWYEHSFRSELKRELTRAYNEAARDPRKRSRRTVRVSKRDPATDRTRLIRAIYNRTPRDYRTRTSGTHNVMLGAGSGHGFSLTTLEKLSTAELRRLARR